MYLSVKHKAGECRLLYGANDWLTYWLTDTYGIMQKHRSPEDGSQSAHTLINCVHESEYSWSSANEEISSILWISEVRYYIHNSSPIVPILSQMNPVYNTPFYYLNIHFNIKFPTKPRSSKWSLSLYPTRATCSAHLIFLDFI